MRYIPAEPLLSPGLLIRAYNARSRPSSGGIRFFALGRDALARFLLDRRVTEGLLYAPSYICLEAVAPAERLGQEVCYYPVGDNLEPDWDWLAANRSSRGKALLLVHYFGFPNSLDEALAFCHEHNLLLIEDCAHSFLTRFRGQAIGTLGDAGFYSYHKTLPLLDGAGLVVKDQDKDVFALEDEDCPAGTSLRAVVKRLVRFGVSRTGVPAPLWRWRQRRIPRYSDTGSAVVEPAPESLPPMSKISHQIMQVLEPDLKKIILTRRRNYCLLARAFSAFPEVQLLYPKLPEGVCPYLFPILVQESEKIVRQLRDRGIPAHGWPDLPQEVVKGPEFTVARYYVDHLLALPVHQDAGPKDLEYVVESYCQVRPAAVG